MISRLLVALGNVRTRLAGKCAGENAVVISSAIRIFPLLLLLLLLLLPTAAVDAFLLFARR
jgi:hypothetical protein